MNAQKKGPAEVAPSPSHGSNNPQKGNAVNRQHNTIAPQPPAMPDMQAAFLELEDLIDRVRRPVNTLDFLIASFGETKPDRHGSRRVEKEEVDVWYDTSLTAREAVRALDERWGQVHGALARHKHHAAFLGEGSPMAGADPLLALVETYDAGLLGYNIASPIVSEKEAARVYAKTVKPSHAVLTGDAVPRPTSMKGVVAAIRTLVREFEEHGGDGRMARAVLPAILAFLDPPKALTVAEAIERHRAAELALGPLFETEAANSTDETRADLEKGETREKEAKTALMRAHPADMREEADRLEYLFSHRGPWGCFAPTPEDGEDLVASLRAS